MEIWKNILDGDYQISNYGQVKSNRRNIILSPGIAATKATKWCI